MQRIAAAAALVVMLAGCGSTRLSNELKPYVGRNVRELAAHLGGPTGERNTGSAHVYVWATDLDTVLPSTPSASGAGNTGELSYAGSTTSTGLMPVTLECTIEVTVDAHSVIQSYEFEGSNAGCARYRHALSH